MTLALTAVTEPQVPTQTTLTRKSVRFSFRGSMPTQFFIIDPATGKNALEIKFIDSFKQMYNDKGSGAHQNGSFWQAQLDAVPGFCRLGDLACSGYANPSGVNCIAVASDLSPDQSALKAPVNYVEIWNDAGTGAHHDGSIWAPIPPDGYVAMGWICQKGYSKPSLNDYRCVRADLAVQSAGYGDQKVWSDKGSGKQRKAGGITADISICLVDAPSPESLESSNIVYFSAGTFLGTSYSGKHFSFQNPLSKAKISPAGYVFGMALTESDPPVIPQPELTGYSSPAPYGSDVYTYDSYLPWFAVEDAGLTDSEKIVSSPYYCLRRSDCYKLQFFAYNDTSVDQARQVDYVEGYSESETKSFQHSVGVSFSAQYAMVPKVLSVTASLSYTFTYSTEETTQVSYSSTQTIETTIPAQTAMALYTIESTFALHRGDGTQISTPVVCDAPNQLYWTQYPAASV